MDTIEYCTCREEGFKVNTSDIQFDWIVITEQNTGMKFIDGCNALHTYCGKRIIEKAVEIDGFVKRR